MIILLLLLIVILLFFVPGVARGCAQAILLIVVIGWLAMQFGGSGPGPPSHVETTQPAPPKAEAEATPPPDEPAPSVEAPPAAAKTEADTTPPSEPTHAPAPLRTPTAFNCAKQHMGADYVICASPELMDAEGRLEDAYRAALHTASADQVKARQWEWIKSYGPLCGLPLRGRPPDEKIHGAAACVHNRINLRILELQSVQ